MSDRLDPVLVAASRGVVGIPSSSRDALLEEIRHLDPNQHIRYAFIAAGVSRPVELKPDDADVLVEAIERWMRRVGGPSQLPAGIFELRRALVHGPTRKDPT